ncbi:ribosome recycling factor [Candidatus Poribacteria bacterium]|nr:ribosome recycling factor [Candidatus Poribacteria bacterium]
MGRETEARMKKAIEATLHEFNAVRTGRASPALLEGIVVEYYGAKTPLNQLATITAPEARMLVVQPWDKGAMKDIQKAITASNLGLNPSTDGTNLRITIPELTEERRKDLAKVVRQTAEDGRVSIRQVRRDAIDELRKQEKASDISEDESRREQTAVQKITDQYIEQVDELLAAKEEELLTI